jgi:hypothetical protein
MKYLTLIRTVALLHQYQRPVKRAEHRGQPVEYIEVAREDIAIANRLAHEVLGRSLDELPPQTRRLLELLLVMVKERAAQKGIEPADERFTRREVREHTGWSYEQLRVHLGRLSELEYLLVHHGGRGQSFVYELVYDGAHGGDATFLPGLLEPTAAPADARTAPTLGGREQEFGVPLGASTGPLPVGCALDKSNGLPEKMAANTALVPRPLENARSRPKPSGGGSYVPVSGAALMAKGHA